MIHLQEKITCSVFGCRICIVWVVFGRFKKERNSIPLETRKLPPREVMYRALLEKDSSFEGIFFVAVKTTGIFCRPTCHARKPKPENVDFYATSKEALDYGYRPCKLCKPMEKYGDVPEWLQPLLQEINQNPGIKLKDYELRQRGIDPARIRRWFKKHHGMTFQAYLRALRINQAFGTLRHGEKVTATAFDSGYESLSGFSKSFQETMGFSPGNSKNGKVIHVARILSPLGPMLAGATDEGICLLEFTDRRMLETQIKRLRKLLHSELVPGDSPFFEPLSKEINAYFEGRLKEFKTPLVVPGTDFQKQVWQQLQTIAYGKTRSYEEQARAIGNPKAIRAVARANGDNRIAIIIPCHRVIGKDGSMTGYGGKIWSKEYLLELERNNA